MSTFNELIYQVRESISGFNVTDDLLPNDELIANLLNTIRSTLIGQDRNKLESVYYQRYSCLDVECLADSCEVDGITIQGNKIHYVDPPQLISGIGIQSIKFLGPSDMSVPFQEIDITQFNTIQHRQYGKAGAYFARTSERIFLKGYDDTMGTKLTLVGLFFDPRSVYLCNGNNNEDYPVPSEYRLLVMAKKDIFTSLGIVPDTTDNAADDKGITKEQQ